MNRLQSTLQLLLIIGLIIVANLLLSSYFYRIDLTRESRYSLSDLTIETARALELPMTVTVYLEGEFPPNIREFQEALRTTLLEVKQYAGSEFEFNFVDPTDNPELKQMFRERGYAPVPIKVRMSSAETRTQEMWPLLVIRYRQREGFVDLLKGAAVMTQQGPNVNFFKAEADLEYKLTSAIRRLTQESSGVVAMLEGHGEIPVDSLPDLGQAIQNQYQLFKFSLGNVPNYEISPAIDVLLILQPTRRFSERDKYELDQYLMRGGSILWVLDQQVVDLNLYRKQSTITKLRDLNLDDLFMRYGCKVNYDLIQDLNCEPTEVFEPETQTFFSKKWLFYPLALQLPEHPLARNVDAVLMRYAASIDTFAQPSVQKSVFLTSSRNSRSVQGSQFIDLNTLINEPPPTALFTQGPLITGLLMEGVFRSLFLGREVPTDSLAPNLPDAQFGPQNNPIAPGRMAIISDGEFVLGKEFRGERSPRLPYDNLDLLMNTIDYLAGDATLSEIRSKEVVVRRLDREKVVDHETSIRLINLLAPIALIVAFGLGRSLLRRRRHQRLQEK
jgi:gliding-associated putative ABC transporter substrate-binding component GldG